MIVKMKFINISGPRDDIDRVTDLYLSRYEIQLESALSELKTVDNLRPFVELNPYRDVLAQATQFIGYLPNVDDVTPDDSLGLDDMFEVVRKACEDYEGLQAKKEKKKAKIEELRAKQQLLSPFRPLDCDLHKVLGYRYITYRFGRIALESYHKMNNHKQYIIGEYSNITLLNSKIYNLYLENRYDELNSIVKTNECSIMEECYYQSIIYGYKNCLSKYETIEFSSLSLENKVAYLHNVASLKALNSFSFDS